MSCDEVDLKTGEGIAVVGGLKKLGNGDMRRIRTGIEAGFRPVGKLAANTGLNGIAGNDAFKAAGLSAGTLRFKSIIGCDMSEFTNEAALTVDKVAVTDVCAADAVVTVEHDDILLVPLRLFP